MKTSSLTLCLACVLGFAGLPVTAATTIVYEHDAEDNLTKRTDPRNQVTDYGYDNLERQAQITQPSPASGQSRPTLIFRYDGQDRLIEVIDPKSLDTDYSYHVLGGLLEQKSPDTGTTKRVYNGAGLLKTETDARNIVATYTYDTINRVTRIDYSDGSFIEYQYDQGIDSNDKNAIGSLNRLTDSSGQTNWRYDGHGRVSAKIQTVGSLNFAVGYTYDDEGLIDEVTYPSGFKLIYVHDEHGRLQRLRVKGSGAAQQVYQVVKYAPFGPPTEVKYVNNRIQTRTYDLDGRQDSYSRDSGFQMLAYDDASRITQIGPVNNPAAQVFSYDNIGRLTGWQSSATTHAYSYDLSGDRTQVTLGANTYIYTTPGSTHRLASVTGPTPKTNIYDAAGNLTGDGTFIYTYDARGRMVNVSGQGLSTAYAIDGFGQRVKKSNTLAVVHFVYDEAGRLLGEYDAAGQAVQEYVWDGYQPVAIIRGTLASPEFFSVETDHLGTPRQVRNGIGTLRWQWDPNPFGTTAPNPSPAGLANFSFNLRFPGQYFDSETAMHYNYFRDYDPILGRYVQSDPLGLNGGVNTYAYTDGNPVSYSDRLGLKPGDLFASPDDAALDAGAWARGQPQGYYIEHGGWIYKEEDCYTYNSHIGRAESLDPNKMRQLKPTTPSAIWHTHPIVGDPRRENNFSGELGFGGSGDRDAADRHGVPIYLHTPAGDTKMYDPIRDAENTLPIYSKPKPCECK